MGKGGKKTTKRKKTTSVKGLPVKDTKAIKGGGTGRWRCGEGELAGPYFHNVHALRHVRSTSADAYTISAVIISMNRGWGGVGARAARRSPDPRR